MAVKPTFIQHILAVRGIYKCPQMNLLEPCEALPLLTSDLFELYDGVRRKNFQLLLPQRSPTSIRFVVGELEYENGAGFLVVSDPRNLCQNIGINILKVD